VIVMFLFFTDEKAMAALDRAGRNGLVERHVTYNHDVLEKRATVLATRGLQPAPTAVTVRPRGGTSTAIPGPHAETAETLGGFYLVECRDMAEAEELARDYPMPEGLGCIELRPVMQSWDYAPTADVPAPPAAVWSHYAEVAAWPSWRHGITAAALDGPLAGGAAGAVEGTGGALAIRIVSAAPDRGFVLDTEVAPGIWLREEHELVALPGGGTRITHRATVPRAALDHFGLEFSPAHNAGMRHSLQRLCAVLTGDPSTPNPAQETADAH
jgi:hypothetical protein